MGRKGLGIWIRTLEQDMSWMTLEKEKVFWLDIERAVETQTTLKVLPTNGQSLIESLIAGWAFWKLVMGSELRPSFLHVCGTYAMFLSSGCWQ